MTVIAAVIGDGHTVIAADRQSNCNGTRYTSPPKVWRHKAGDDEVVLAFAGVVDIATRVQLGLNIDATPGDPHDRRECWQWADAIASAVWELVTGREGREDLRADQDKNPIEYDGLLAWRHWLFHLSSLGNAEPEQATYSAVGSGEDVATGALHALTRATDLKPRELVVAAVEAANDHLITCGGGVTVETMRHTALQGAA